MASVSGSSSLSADSSASYKPDVWQYFTKDKECKKAKCQLCSKELAFHSSTTNFREHLMNRHSGSYKGDRAKKREAGELFKHSQGLTLAAVVGAEDPGNIAHHTGLFGEDNGGHRCMLRTP